ncbi:PfkB family carbohydrate kinase [Nocardia callitridis]|uniref:PfkB family carbohydrate kinase n=1 Tax=Nocardia callitridis TaxID=648753 RepID=A0ABP9K4H5_9NOCA
MVAQDAGVLAVRNILTRLSKRSGLSPDRLHNTEIDVSPLLDLLAVRQYAHRAGIGRVEAVIALVRDLTRQLEPTDRLIADAELCLGLLRETAPAGIDLDHLYASDLGERREYLSTQWRRLHETLGVQNIPPAPSVRSLRANPERRAFTALAERLATGSVFDGASTYSVLPTQPIVAHEDSPQPQPATITVVGDAVIDHMYLVDRIPGPGGTARGTFDDHPGGKGLARAVAAARLGLRVRLICAVGDDDAGRRILDYLRSEGVDTEFVKVVPFAPTPVTSVTIAGTGESSTIGCKDDRVRLSAQDLRSPHIKAALTSSDAVLLTFEQPLAVLEHILGWLRHHDSPPLLVIHPAPSVSRPQQLYQYLSAADYLVGSVRELEAVAMAAGVVPDAALTPSGHGGGTATSTVIESGAKAAGMLRALGVPSVCAIQDFTCTVWSDRVEATLDPFPTALRDSLGAHAAFSAALVYRLLSTRRPADQQDYLWATAAMVATQSIGNVPGAMPLATEIDRIATLATEEH